jgi:predicted ATP-grasp superfamily ATP-dependent carboligase
MRQFGSRLFRYCGNILPLPEMLMPEAAEGILKQVRRVAEFLTREYGLIGVNGVDFILKGNEVCLIEVNPRYSASMELIEQSYGVPMFHIHAQAVLDELLPDFRLGPGLKSESFSGKAILYAEKRLVVPDTTSWLDRSIRDVPSAGEQLIAGSPVCTIMTRQPTYQETLDDLIRQAALLREEIYA